MDNHSEPIAVIGMGCRLPEADNPTEFWNLLIDGVDAITEIPSDRFEIDRYYDAEQGKSGKMNTRWGGFIRNVDQFDADFFGISPREAASMDPQQRVLLEVAYEALEAAGIPLGRAQGSDTGVYIGISTHDYSDRRLEADLAPTSYTGTGSAYSLAANRLSYVFDLHGPSLAVDTACSSSLVATHLACQSLRNGECDTALAGGVNLIVAPTWTLAFSQARMLSSDGRCKTFDADANGYVRAEGCGVVVLKRLSDAMRDGDPIVAVIRATGSNQDGRTNGVTVPNGDAQQTMIRRTLRAAGLSAADISYVEAHGTGTPTGDPIEIEALKAVLLEGRAPDRPCIIGAGKANVGHMEAASGVVALIRTALILQHREVPPQLHLKEMNPRISLDETPLRIVTERQTLDGRGQPLRAGVNGFGFGGANCHVILEEAPVLDRIPRASIDEPLFLPLSAKSPEALTAAAQAYRTFLSESEETLDLGDLCYTAGSRRTHHTERLGLVAESREEFMEQLDVVVAGETQVGVVRGTAGSRTGKLAFVFSGMGSQWIGMGQELLAREPIFRAAIERCDAAMRPYSGWSVFEELAAPSSESRLDDIGILQPVLFAIGVGLADLWRSWGIEPDGVVGHSVGEVAAAHVAGVLSLDTAARIVCHRGAVLRQVSGKGAMVSVGLTSEEAAQAVKGYEGRVSVAVINSRGTTVLSGEPDAIQEIATQLEARGVLCRMVRADIAFHGPQMDLLRAAFLEGMQEVQPSAGAIPMYSTVTGQRIAGKECTAQYWIRNLREPVSFARAVEELFADGFDAFIELSPHPVLVHSIREVAQAAGAEATALPSLRRKERERKILLQSAAALYVEGRPIRFEAVSPPGQFVALPGYVWQRERYWLEEDKPRRRRHDRADGHPLLGVVVRSALHTDRHVWEVDLDFETFPYLADHRAGESVLFPAAAYIEMALAAAEALQPGAYQVEGATFSQGLVLAAEGIRTLQLVLSSSMPGKMLFEFYSLDPGTSQGQESWILHASGVMRSVTDQDNLPETMPAIEEIEVRCRREDSAADHYRAMQKRALNYGPAFQPVGRIRLSDDEAIAHVHLPAGLSEEAGRYRIHPSLLDACFQVVAALLPLDPYLPTAIETLRVYDSPTGDLWIHGIRQAEDRADGTFDGDALLFNADGRVIAEVRGLRLQRRKRAAEETRHQWLYETRWERTNPVDRIAKPSVPPHLHGTWLIMAAQRELGSQLGTLLAALGEASILVTWGDRYERVSPSHFRVDPGSPEDFHRLLREAVPDDSLRAVVHLAGADSLADDTLSALRQAQLDGPVGVLHLVQGLSQASLQPRLWLVTRGAQPVEGMSVSGAAQSPLVGLGAVLSQEHPEMQCRRIDLDPAGCPQEIEELFRAILADDREDEVALRGSERYVPRLVRHQRSEATGERVEAVSSDEPFRLTTEQPGVLDNLALRFASRSAPAPGEVEIKVKAAGLNFRDIMSAMGILPGYPDGLGPLGYECSGVVTTVGDGVEHLRPGDEVVALAYHAFGTYVVTNAHLVVPKPSAITFGDAATIPITFLTAYYGLNHLARLEEGERILIHSASGGVGLAAIQMAQAVGAEIFATAGSPEKREFLRSLGVRHVMDSRSLNFAAEIMQETNGAGVDVVLNSLAGEYIPTSLSVLAPYGRFLELGRKDIYQNSPLGLQPFQRNLSFFAIDLDKLYSERPAFVGKLFTQVMHRVAAGELHPLPIQTYPVAEAVAAFRQMAQAKHIGKIVISLETDTAQVRTDAARCRPDATYLVTGGLGSLGLEVARLLAALGARSLVLTGRRGASAEGESVLAALQAEGCRVTVLPADVTETAQVRALLDQIAATLPPLRGVIHAAGVLDDGTMLQLDRERFERVLAPKVAGAWNLHQLTREIPLDFFILFSSVTTLLGSAGQSNYVAANQFLDALAWLRHSQGLPASSIAWGPWSDVGMASSSGILRRFASQGIDSIAPDQGTAVLASLLNQNLPHINVLPMDWKRYVQSNARAADTPFLSELVTELQSSAPDMSASARSIRDAVLQVPGEQRQEVMEQYVRDQVVRMLGPAARKLGVDQPLTSLGLDSLMAVELRNRLRTDVSADVPVQVFLDGSSISRIATLLLVQLMLAEATLPDRGESEVEYEEITL